MLEADSEDFDFAGLQNIERITGILLISNLTVTNFTMKSLRVIEGNDADHKSLPECSRNGCSLIVKDNHFKTFSFPKLTEISKGDVVFNNNDKLCYFFSYIPWAQILHSDFRAAGRAYWLDDPIRNGHIPSVYEFEADVRFIVCLISFVIVLLLCIESSKSLNTGLQPPVFTMQLIYSNGYVDC